MGKLRNAFAYGLLYATGFENNRSVGTEFYRALEEKRDDDAMHLLRKAKAPFSIEDSSGRNLLDGLVAADHVDMFKRVVAAFPSFLESTYNGGETAITRHAGNCSLTMLTAIVDAGIDIFERNGSKETGFMTSMRRDPLPVLNYFLGKGLPIDNTNSIGETALMIAAQRQPPEVIQALMATGANIHVVDTRGMNATMRAMHNSNWDAAIPLLRAGGVVDDTSEDLARGLRVATYEGDFDFISAVGENARIVLANKTESQAAAVALLEALGKQHKSAQIANTAAIGNAIHTSKAKPRQVKTVRFKNPAAP